MSGSYIPKSELQRAVAGEATAVDRIQRWVAAWGATSIRVIYDPALAPMHQLTIPAAIAQTMTIDTFGIHIPGGTLESERYRFSGNTDMAINFRIFGERDIPWKEVRDLRQAAPWEEL